MCLHATVHVWWEERWQFLKTGSFLLPWGSSRESNRLSGLAGSTLIYWGILPVSVLAFLVHPPPQCHTILPIEQIFLSARTGIFDNSPKDTIHTWHSVTSMNTPCFPGQLHSHWSYSAAVWSHSNTPFLKDIKRKTLCTVLWFMAQLTISKLCKILNLEQEPQILNKDTNSACLL